MVETDELCETCHATYSQRFAKNVHHEISCEQCHGGATVHLETRGTEAGTILSFRKPEKGTKAGKLLTAAERSEICLRCHEGGQNGQQGPCVDADWRRSAHAHRDVACTDCHRAYYLVPPGTPPVEEEARAPSVGDPSVWLAGGP